MARKKSSSQPVSEFSKEHSFVPKTLEHLQNNYEFKTITELRNNYRLYTINQLKYELKKKGLKTSGNKSVLVNRLSTEMTLNGDSLKRRTITPEPGVKCNGMSSQITNNHDGEQSHKARLKAEQLSLVLWKKPLTTILYCLREFIIVSTTFFNRLLECKKTVLLAFLVILTIILSSRITGPHQEVLRRIYKEGIWCVYWLGLGVLSSVGLGTGLHTFLLYLGPHIASVTLAAYECGSLNFPEPPYPDQIICPELYDDSWKTSLWNIMRKVKLEAIMWGAGTALGELPPYFMARAARLSGYDPEDEEELREFEELQQKKNDPSSMTFVDKIKLSIENIVNKVGFFGILACASVPNPLFDLAGITCGHFLIPFWTFFGATLIGKALIKMSIQVLFVIIAFNEVLIEKAAEKVSLIPAIGPYLQAPLTEFLDTQKKRLHSKSSTPQELGDLRRNGLKTFRDIQVDESNILTWQGLIVPDNPPYNKGAFRIEINFPAEYPFKPPRINFRTKIYHPNIDDKGQVCLPIISPENWKPATKTDQVIQALVAMVNEPEPDHPLRAELAEEYMKDRKKFFKNAEEYTRKYGEKKPVD